MQHPIIVSGGNPAAAAAAAHGLNVAVPSYMPMYQLPQIHQAAAAQAAPEPPTEQGAGAAGGGMEGKHGD